MSFGGVMTAQSIALEGVGYTPEMLAFYGIWPNTAPPDEVWGYSTAYDAPLTASTAKDSRDGTL